eukprot:TRINITY_DN1042_c0_g1_i2.p1 TRINITY_DN1042_c0_g1~~TRINITY_DN1042_c0_g1_i2.p1  ORF type:complete len:600 (+),score=105.06 TRINITY_DN1042_c0_g1_i2:136-1935(+)
MRLAGDEMLPALSSPMHTEHLATSAEEAPWETDSTACLSSNVRDGDISLSSWGAARRFALLGVVLFVSAVGLTFTLQGSSAAMHVRHKMSSLLDMFTSSTPPMPTRPDQVLPFQQWMQVYQVQPGALQGLLYKVYANHPQFLAARGEMSALVQYQAAHDCPKLELDVDFNVGFDLLSIPGMDSSGWCQKSCTDNSACVAWSWGAVRDRPGITDVCFLKKAAPEPHGLRRHNGKGMISGLPCNREGGEFWWAWADWQYYQLPTPEQPVHDPEVVKCEHPLYHPCRDDHEDCCAPLQYDETAKCAHHFVPVREEGICSGFNDAKFICCPSHAVTKPKKKLPTVHCVALFMAFSYEQDLILYQHKKKVGIFQCDSHAIYSSQVIELAPGLVSRRIHHSMKAEPGGQFVTVLNLGIFLALYRQLILDKHYLHADWIVKVDPDTVFFADRLRQNLNNYNFGLGDSGVFLNNCPEGLHGPIEVFSQRAFLALAENAKMCYDSMNGRACDAACQAARNVCNGDCTNWWGEDIWADRCLTLHTQSKRLFGRHLLQEEHCPETAAYSKYSWQSCKDTRTVAFHPFKSKELWETCLHEAEHANKAEFDV